MILRTIRRAWEEYPRQYWLMFFGMLISTAGGSMIWPFLLRYLKVELGIPDAWAGLLYTSSSAAGLLSSFVASPIIDRAGRKGVMVISLVINALGLFLMGQLHSPLLFALMMTSNGAFNPLYRVAADAMVADMIPPEKRADAYSLTRMSNNIGVALGPTLGGLVAAYSYTLAFSLAAAGLVTYGLLIAFFARETIPQRTPEQAAQRESLGGYGAIFRDHHFIFFVAAFTFNSICASLIWIRMSDYAIEVYKVPMSLYGLIPTTNGLMVIFLQLLVTQVTKRFAPLKVMPLGAALYALSVTSVALASGFWGFWTIIVVMTIGELILVPTSSTYAANLAPADKRGRYMGLYGLTWGVASGIGPLFAGMVGSAWGAEAPWFFGGTMGLVSVLGFLALAAGWVRRKPIAL